MVLAQILLHKKEVKSQVEFLLIDFHNSVLNAVGTNYFSCNPL